MKGSKAPAAMVRKAERAVRIAKMILGDDASAKDIEDTSVAMMFVPDAQLEKMHKRLIPTARASRRKARER